MLYQHFNTPTSHDWFLEPQRQIAAPPALVQSNDEHNLSYPPYHSMWTSSADSANNQPLANSLVYNTGGVASMGIRENQQLDYPVRWRSMDWPRELYPPTQGLRPPNNMSDLGVKETPKMLEHPLMHDGAHISSIVHRLTPLYYPRAFFHTIGPHNFNLVLLSLRHLEAMAPRAEESDENGQNEVANLSSNEMAEYRVPTPPWLGDPKPWLHPVLPACDVPMELDPCPTEEARGRECLKIKIDLRRVLPTCDTSMELDPRPTEETRGRERLKIRIDPRRLRVLRKEQRVPY